MAIKLPRLNLREEQGQAYAFYALLGGTIVHLIRELAHRYDNPQELFLSIFIFNYSDLGINSRGLLGQLTRFLFGDNSVQSATSGFVLFSTLSFLVLLYGLYKAYKETHNDKLYMIICIGTLLCLARIVTTIAADFVLMAVFALSLLALYKKRYLLLFLLSCFGVAAHNIYFVLFMPFVFALVVYQRPEKQLWSMLGMALVGTLVFLLRTLQTDDIATRCISLVSSNTICFSLTQTVRQAVEFVIALKYTLRMQTPAHGIAVNSINTIVVNIITVLIIISSYFYTWAYALRYNKVKFSWLYLAPLSLICALIIAADYWRWFAIALFVQLAIFYMLSKLNSSFSLRFIQEPAFYHVYVIYWALSLLHVTRAPVFAVAYCFGLMLKKYTPRLHRYYRWPRNALYALIAFDTLVWALPVKAIIKTIVTTLASLASG